METFPPPAIAPPRAFTYLCVVREEEGVAWDKASSYAACSLANLTCLYAFVTIDRRRDIV